MDTENILFLQEHEAEAALALYAERGSAAVIAHLSQWHQPGNHDTGQVADAHHLEERHIQDGYVLTVNSSVGYIGLQFDEAANR